MWVSELGEAAFRGLWCVEFAGSLFISLMPYIYIIYVKRSFMIS
jgi:hypothetical protein